MIIRQIPNEYIYCNNNMLLNFNAQQVNFRPSGSSSRETVSGQCRDIVSPNSTALFCTVPSLPPGVFSVSLVNSKGENSTSIDVTASLFISQTIITSLGSFVGSLAGGNPLFINTNATVRINLYHCCQHTRVIHDSMIVL